MDSLVVTRVEFRSCDERVLSEINALQNRIAAESRPTDPPTPVEVTVALARNLEDFVEESMWLVRDETGRLVAYASASVAHVADNQHAGWADVAVEHERRREGVARTLVPGIVEHMRRTNRRLVNMWSTDRVPAGAAFLQRLGGTPGLPIHVNELVLSDVDRIQLRRWVEEGERRAAGYALELIDGPYPDDRLEEILTIQHVINDAPRGELDVEDFEETPEMARQHERRYFSRGFRRWCLFARDTETGELAGWTELGWNPNAPQVVNQRGTGVAPPHRGHGIGIWMKAVMLAKVLDEIGGAERVRTGNAYANQHMLAINHALGFRHAWTSTWWQVEVDAMARYAGVPAGARGG